MRTEVNVSINKLIDLWCYRVPSWRLHEKWGKRLLGSRYRREIDERIDRGDFEVEVSGFRLRMHHDAGRSGALGEFWDVANHFLREYGYDGLVQFVLHHVLDRLSYLMTRKYDIRTVMIKLRDWLSELSRPGGEVAKAIAQVLRFVEENADEICRDLRLSSVNSKRVLLDRLRPYAQSACAIVLMKRGYFARRGFKADFSAFRRLSSLVLRRLIAFIDENSDIFADANGVIAALNALEGKYYKAYVLALRDSGHPLLRELFSRLMRFVGRCADELGLRPK